MEKVQVIPGIAELTFDIRNILRMKIRDKSTIDADAAHKIVGTANRMTGYRIHANLVDIRQVTFISSEARKLFGSQNKSTARAVAIVMNSTLHRPLMNLYLKFSSPLLPPGCLMTKIKLWNGFLILNYKCCYGSFT
jgi:hypothetical protein